jgi:hypothetical protein
VKFQQTLASPMSGSDPKPEKLNASIFPPFIQQRTHAPRQTACLFDHVVGTGEQCWRDIEPKRLGSLEVDYQVELRGLFDGKVCGASTCLKAANRPLGGLICPDRDGTLHFPCARPKRYHITLC